MVCHLRPALKDYLGTAATGDPFKDLKYIRNKVWRNKYWLNGADNVGLVERSFDGRTAVVHLDVDEVVDNGEDIVYDWADICDETRQYDDANDLRALLPL